MNDITLFRQQVRDGFNIVPERRETIETIEDFDRLIGNIRERPLKTLAGFWFNLIEYRGHQFIQGDLRDKASPDGILRHIAALTDGVRGTDIEGFWPEVACYPVDQSEEAFIAAYLARQGNNDVELIVPERNTARPITWGRFNEGPEFQTYKNIIYPSIIKAIETIETHHNRTGISLCMECVLGPDRSGQGECCSVLDMGCGCGDLIESIQRAGCAHEHSTRWEVCGCGNLMQVNCVRIPSTDCCGIDINTENIEAGREKGIGRILQGDGEDLEALLPSSAMFDIIIFCGLLNRQVTSRAKAGRILQESLRRLKHGGHIIVTGYTSCHFTAKDLSGMGLDVLRKSITEHIFRDYQGYWLRQLYVARKM
jgi:SAM-dependent methyltransferase